MVPSIPDFMSVHCGYMRVGCMLRNSALTKERALLSRKPGYCINISQMDCLHSVKKNVKKQPTACPEECPWQRSHSPWQRQNSFHFSIRREWKKCEKAYTSLFCISRGVCFSRGNKKLNMRWELTIPVRQKNKCEYCASNPQCLLIFTQQWRFKLPRTQLKEHG